VKVRLQRVALVAAMGIVTLNIWTGAPLLGLWVGSRVAPDSGISMLSFFLVAVVIGAAAWILLRILGHLQLIHGRVTGQPQARRQTSWLRPMSGARSPREGGEAPPMTAADYVVVTMVILAVAAFEIWFFFFAGSSLDGRSGR
jgi:hypothetical protein